MQQIRSDHQLTTEEILTSIEQSIVLSSSSYASLSSVRRQRFRNVLAPEYASLVHYDSETPSKFLFGDNIADEVEKHSKEQRIIEKISKNSFQQSSCPMHAKQPVQEREQQLQPKISQTSSSSKKKTCIQKKSTIRIQKQKSKSKVRSLNPLTGRTRLYFKNWRNITQSKSV